MSKQKKPEWKKHLPKSKKEQNEIWKMYMQLGSTYYQKAVKTDEEALNVIEIIINKAERNQRDFDEVAAVILNFIDKKYKPSLGVELVKEALLEIVKRND